MPKVRIEPIDLGKGDGGNPENVITARNGGAVTLDVTSTATASGSRPQIGTANSRASRGTVRLTALDGNVLAAWGTDPTADQTNSLLLVQGVSEVLNLTKGDLMSFVLPS